MAAAKISIIIPVLNEAKIIKSTLVNLENASDVEVIVVDGGSQDDTVAIAKSHKVKVLFCTPGRARQMNAGAASATGEMLLFLHGDTLLPAGFDTMMRQTLAPDNARINPVAGAFELGIDGEARSLRLIEQMVKMRSRYLQMPYGDQAIFLKTNVFRDIGGFPDLPIMEDFEFIRRLQKLGKIEIVPAQVLTSGRRWQKLGILKTTLLNQLVIFAYFLGVPPATIAGWYRRKY
jgi:rSAM/selenodomain-associated transferase 2